MAAAAVAVVRQNARLSRSTRNTAKQREPSDEGCMPCRYTRQENDPVSTDNFPVSFHLQLHLGSNFRHGYINSVELLRLPLMKTSSDTTAENEALAKAAGTKFEILTKKYVPRTRGDHDADQEGTLAEELLIATERRLFLVSRLVSSVTNQLTVTTVNDFHWTTKSEELEIVDSIPLEEVETIRLYRGGGWDGGTANRKQLNTECVSGTFYKCCSQIMKCLLREEKQELEDPGSSSLAESFLSIYPDDDNYEGFLKITTKPDGFNRGRPFYFMVNKHYYRSKKKCEIGAAAAAPSESAAAAEPPLRGRLGSSFEAVRRSLDGIRRSSDRSPDRAIEREHLEKVHLRLSTLAEIRKMVYKSEHRFQLIQENLQTIWDSFAFNICVLILIVSNFIFTVQQLENKDPSKQAFYETIDLVYTTFFSAGNARARPCPVNTSAMHSCTVPISRDFSRAPRS
jgi:hypothetical protein